jgi:predicted nucleic acid-binding Zn ribbon protein
MEVIAMKVEVRFWKQVCPVCQTEFTTASDKRRFCSRKCRERYWAKVSNKRLLADPIRKQKSLERLFAWKEAHGKRKQAKAHEINMERDMELGGDRNGV